MANINKNLSPKEILTISIICNNADVVLCQSYNFNTPFWNELSSIAQTQKTADVISFINDPEDYSKRFKPAIMSPFEIKRTLLFKNIILALV